MAGTKKSGRRRWGPGITGLGESTDDWDDLEFSLNLTDNKPRPSLGGGAVNKRRESEESIFT